VAFSALLPRNVTIAPGLYRAMAGSVLSLHAVYMAWVIFGAFLKKRCENGEYADPMAAESAFRKFVEDERSCQKAKAV